MITKPTRPWKNLEAARTSIGYIAFEHPNEFPCLACGGRGGFYDESDNDPIEGYKMATLHKCKSCNGTRLGPQAVFKEHYKHHIDKYKRALAEYKQKIKRFKELKKQLSKEDWNIIRECL